VKILKFWKTELSYAQNKNRREKMRLLGIDTCPSLNDTMEIRLSIEYEIKLPPLPLRKNKNDNIKVIPVLDLLIDFSNFKG
jgi:hypothetical protein